MHGCAKAFPGMYKNEPQNRFSVNGWTTARQWITPVAVRTPVQCTHMQETGALNSIGGRTLSVRKINEHSNNLRLGIR
eukprot:12593656-Ditylum_brightwellii.AAC.1